jgi:ethylbenzene dioxygenase beta subunit
MSDAWRHSVEAFLYREARLLDDRQFRDWLDLLTDNICYWMPTRHNRRQPQPKILTSGGDQCGAQTLDP